MLISKSGAQPASDVCNSTTTNDTLTFYYYDKFDEIFSKLKMLTCADTIIGAVSVLYLGFLILSIVSIIVSTIAAGMSNRFKVNSTGIICWISIDEILLVTVYLMFVDRDILLRWICGNLPWCQDIKRFCCD